MTAVAKDDFTFVGLTEGRNVHYVLKSGEHRPAIVTRVTDKNKGICTLNVFFDTSRDTDEGSPVDRFPNAVIVAPVDCRVDVPFSPSGDVHTWHWIERA